MFTKIKCGLVIAAGSILNIYPSVSAASPRNQAVDSQMIARDWCNVGNDIAKAIRIYESKQTAKLQ